MSDIAQAHSQPKAIDGNVLALDRTRLAYERTLMAWTRTGVSLISFGFSIYKFFDLQRPSAAAADDLIGPRLYGFLMIATGLVAMLLATIQHRQNLKSLRATGVAIPISLAAIVALLISGLGILALLAVVLGE